jgi:hypothetical protein
MEAKEQKTETKEIIDLVVENCKLKELIRNLWMTSSFAEKGEKYIFLVGEKTNGEYFSYAEGINRLFFKYADVIKDSKSGLVSPSYIDDMVDFAEHCNTGGTLSKTDYLEAFKVWHMVNHPKHL